MQMEKRFAEIGTYGLSAVCTIETGRERAGPRLAIHNDPDGETFAEITTHAKCSEHSCNKTIPLYDSSMVNGSRLLFREVTVGCSRGMRDQR